MSKPLNEENNDEVCKTCGGTGEVITMETVYPGEPYQAPIGTAPCPDCGPKPDCDDQDE